MRAVDTPRFVRGYDLTIDDRLILPRGLRHAARNCLVLTRRVAHLDALAALLAARGHQPLVLQGGMSASDRRAAVDRLADTRPGDGVLLIGTTPFIGEGCGSPGGTSVCL